MPAVERLVGLAVVGQSLSLISSKGKKNGLFSWFYKFDEEVGFWNLDPGPETVIR
jgi:hypothetical protein